MFTNILSNFNHSWGRVFNIIKEQKDGVLTVRLSGSLDESVSLEQLIGTPPTELHVYTKEIRRINSIGVKTWIKFFQNTTKRGTIVKFYECSTAVVEQVNAISNFTSGGSVESIFVPFACMNCKSELVGLFKASDLKKIQFKIPDLKCSKCGGKAVFDDIPEEYFGFLGR